jgi:hypothetical protein
MESDPAMKSLLRLSSMVTAATLAGMIVGCTSIPFLQKENSVTVKVPVEGDVAEVPIPTTGSKRYQTAVTYMGYASWPDALRELQAEVAEKPNEWRAVYALAVTQEVTGDYTNAKANYIKADALNGGGTDLNCQAGVSRIELRGK